MTEKNVVSSVMESVAVEFGLDDAYEKAQNLKNEIDSCGIQQTIDNHIDSAVQKASDTVDAVTDKAKEVGGYLKEDFNNLKEGVKDLFASKEEKQRKAEEKAAKEAQEKAEKEEQERLEREMRDALDKSYILHTAMIVCDKAYTNEAINPSYIVVPQSHGESIHGLPQLNVNDYIPDVNVLNFGICRSPQNPAVQAEAARILEEVREESKSWTDKLLNLFVDTSKKDVCTNEEESLAACCAAPCTPVIGTRWIDGKYDVLVDGAPALLGRCTLQCMYGGAITIQSSGQAE